MMTIADFEEKIALGRTPCDQGYCLPRFIIRTPGNERRVISGDLSAARGDKKPEPATTNAKPRLCTMDCGTRAAVDDVYCEDCRSVVGCH
jgi:hypothetical protein